ncbi:MAG: hypothetical protein JW850_07865 [Thermoflexales bacterium]|nr:hypothetical protein [Thermoflexales bacterium]
MLKSTFAKIAFVSVLGLLLAACGGGNPQVAPATTAAQPLTEVEAATAAASAPTVTPEPPKAPEPTLPPMETVAAPVSGSPAITPTAKVVTTTTGGVPALQSDLPGVLWGKTLEAPSKWEERQDAMIGHVILAWRCDNQGLKPRVAPATEITDLISKLDDKAAFDKAVADLQAQGFEVRVSKPLVYTDEYGSLPIDQTTDCKALKALDLWGTSPTSLPARVGASSARRAGTVDGKPAYERVWIALWK